MDNPTRVIKELLSTQRLAVVATPSDGQPYTNLVAFACSDSIWDIVFATRKDTNKFRNLSKDPRTSLLIDDRNNSPEDIYRARVVTAMGLSKEILNSERERIEKIYLNKHPYLEEFIRDPLCALIKLWVDHYIVVEQFSVVKVIRCGERSNL
jgi:nitroimidazol reductase NimA-like FMN-containing flavoprotein (pyridoxamine 5'-phosphate oxidase superfamily)